MANVLKVWDCPTCPSVHTAYEGVVGEPFESVYEVLPCDECDVLGPPDPSELVDLTELDVDGLILGDP